MSEPLFLVGDLPAGGVFHLDGPEGRHAADVQRLRPGESLVLSDGRGGLAAARVVATGRGTVDCEITQRRTVEPADPRLVVVQGIAKGDRSELAVQAMTEVGVDGVVPWAASRSVVQWRGERGDRALERWRAIAREATKQARRPWLPTVAAQATTAAVAALCSSSQVLVLHEEATGRLATAPLTAQGDICLVVGPEGGVSPEELDQFVAAGAVPVRLGPTVLRTSTAGVAALSVLSARLNRW